MSFWEILFLAVGLSMDAFAVAVCKGLAAPKLYWKHLVIVGAWFGGFQALMPLLGYLLGSTFQHYIESFDHWVAFILLAFIGVNMIREALSKETSDADCSFGWRSMAVMAVATSIDALAVGVTFAFLNVEIVPAVTVIGVTTFLLSALGVKVGNRFGVRYRTRAELVGGIILILLGLKILLGHLGMIS